MKRWLCPSSVESCPTPLGTSRDTTGHGHEPAWWTTQPTLRSRQEPGWQLNGYSNATTFFQDNTDNRFQAAAIPHARGLSTEATTALIAPKQQVSAQIIDGRQQQDHDTNYRGEIHHDAGDHTVCRLAGVSRVEPEGLSHLDHQDSSQAHLTVRPSAIRRVPPRLTPPAWWHAICATAVSLDIEAQSVTLSTVVSALTPHNTTNALVVIPAYGTSDQGFHWWAILGSNQ